MHVLLDTNIYLTDLLLVKPEFEALANYLKKTNSKIAVPMVVDGEVKKNIKQIAYQDARSLKGLNHVKAGLIQKIPTTDSLIDELTGKYEAYIEPRHFIISHGDLDLNAIIDKSLNETAPFKSQGRGFRDAVIWESLISYLKKEKTESIVAFITNNTSDFGDNELKRELKEELERLGLADRVIYFNDLHTFLSEFSESIEFINDDFIETVLGDSIHEESLYIEMDDIEIDYKHTDAEVEIINTNYQEYDIESYFIYRSTSRYYYLYVEVQYTLDVELEVTNLELDHNFDISYNTAYEFTPGYAMREIELRVDKKTHEVEII